MKGSYTVIDSDGHVLEPPDLWERYADPKYRDGCPKLIENGTQLRFEDDCISYIGRAATAATQEIGGVNALGDRQFHGLLGAFGRRDGTVTENLSYLEGKKGGFDPNRRIVDMDAEGIDAAFLYPSLGLMLGSIRNPDFAAASTRAYNRWLLEYCHPYPNRLFGVAILPMQSVESAVAELKFAAQAGYRAAFVRPNPCNGRVLHSTEYYPLWEEAQNLNIAIGVHSGSGSNQPTLGADRFQSPAARHLATHTLEMIAAATSFIMCGICDRFPRLRIGFMESGGGWMAGLLDRMDRHYDDKGIDTGLSTRPSDIFRRQCFISFEPVERTLPLLVDYIGRTNILWATDYPHADGFPGAPRMIKELGLTREALADVLAGGAKRLYGL
jgi:predicted TIM-barrel fold metal-dependent hydrolase